MSVSRQLPHELGRESSSLHLQSARRGAQGFTLTELVIVMVLVSILSVMAVTSLSGLASAQQNVAATRIRTALVYAQEWAMGSNNDTWVAFDTSTDLLSVYVEDPSSPGKAGRLALTDPLTRGPLTIQFGTDGVGLETADFGGTTEVQFDQLGLGYDGNGGTLAGNGSVSVTGGGAVVVTKGTGFIHAN